MSDFYPVSVKFSLSVDYLTGHGGGLCAPISPLNRNVNYEQFQWEKIICTDTVSRIIERLSSVLEICFMVLLLSFLPGMSLGKNSAAMKV